MSLLQTEVNITNFKSFFFLTIFFNKQYWIVFYKIEDWFFLSRSLTHFHIQVRKVYGKDWKNIRMKYFELSEEYARNISILLFK